MADYQDGEAGFLLEASGIEATFADGTTIDSFSNITTKTNTPLGDEVWLTAKEDNSRIVRLIVIAPERDWRRNQSTVYEWKLDSAWMSDPEEGWLHWNAQADVDSMIRIPPSVTLSSSEEYQSPASNNITDTSGETPDGISENRLVFECDSLELHFRPLAGNRGGFGINPMVTDKRIMFQNFRLGAHLASDRAGELLPTRPYSPCPPGSSECSIVDGNLTGLGLVSIASQGVLHYYWGLDASWTPFVRSLVGIALVLGILLCCCISRQCGHRTRNKSYQSLDSAPSGDNAHEDLVLTTDEGYRDVLPASPIDGVINETR